MANTVLTPQVWRYHTAQNFLSSFDDGTNRYYIFIGDHLDETSSTLDPLVDDGQTKTSAYQNMIQGKHVASNDVSLMIRNIPYTSSTVFDMYDDTVDLVDSDYYCIVNASSYYHIFKCLDNNLGAQSTIQPAFSDISGANTNLYRTSDGYVWKYMTSIDSTTMGKFATASYFPVRANATVTSQAVDGALDVIYIEDQGAGYNNYLSGSFVTNDLRIAGDPTVYQISNSSIKTTNGYYTGCLIYLSGGTGSGQYKIITDYYSNANGNYITIESAFSTAPTNGTAYQINPNVLITGSGEQTINAVARALVNSSNSNSIYRVEMLERGAGYSYVTANVVANSVVGVLSNAVIRPIYSPPNGHGYNAAEELGASWASVSLKMSNSESNTILTSNKFKQIGLLKNPQFANVYVNVGNVVGNFLAGEPVKNILAYTIGSNANTYSNTTVKCTTANFAQSLSNGQLVYLTNANNTLNQLVAVNTVINSTVFTTVSAVSFTNNSIIVAVANVKATGTLNTVASATQLVFSRCERNFNTGDFIVGNTSGAVATVNNVIRNDVTKDFETFVNLHKYTGTVASGSFVANEKVYQGNLNTANATYHSVVNNGSNVSIYVSNQVGVFSLSSQIVGVNSGAHFSMTNRYSSELVFGSGQIIYLENIHSINRANNQSETFQLIFNF